LGITDGKESLESSWIGSNGLHLQNSSNSNSSTSSSSTSSSKGSTSTSDSDAEKTVVSGELEADADSLATKQSHLTSADQLDVDGSKILRGGKRGRSNGAELISEAATVKTARKGDIAGPELIGHGGERSANYTVKSGCTLIEMNTVGVSSTTAAAVRSPWNWPDNDANMGMEFGLADYGDFSDFFDDETLGFGEILLSLRLFYFLLVNVEMGWAVQMPEGWMDQIKCFFLFWIFHLWVILVSSLYQSRKMLRATKRHTKIPDHHKQAVSLRVLQVEKLTRFQKLKLC
jgi:hypothetical protein